MAEKLQYELTVSTRQTGTGARDASADIERLRQQVDGLNEKVRVQEFATYDLSKALLGEEAAAKQVQVSQAALDAQRARAMQTVRQLREEQERANTATHAMAGGTRNAGMAALEFSRAVEDAQYGIRGVLNNIPSLVMMLGGSAGLAGAASLGAVAIAALWGHIEKLQQKAKEATAAGQEMTEELRDLLATVEGRKIEDFLAELDLLATQYRQLAESQDANIRIEREREDSLARIAEKLREQAQLEIELARARGQLTDEQAQAQIDALAGEAEVAVRQAKLIELDRKVGDAQVAYNRQLEQLNLLEERRARIEAELGERQGGQGTLALSRNIQALENVRSAQGQLSPQQEQQLALLSAELDALQEADKQLVEELRSIAQERATTNQEAFSIAQQLDEALAMREIGAQEVAQLADIAEQGAQTALLTAAERTRDAMQAVEREASEQGRQLGEEFRGAMAEVNRALADGAVDPQELGRLRAVANRFLESNDQARGEIREAFEAMLRATEASAALGADLKSRVLSLEGKIRAIATGS